jgi:prepilin-type N-terminal cleavage/methylation domain-containing protein
VRQGFTLVETIICLGLMGLLMSLLAMLMGDSWRVMKKVGQREHVLYAAGQAVDGIARDLRSAVQVVVPAGTALATSVEVRKVDPWSDSRTWPNQRLPLPIPSPPPASWRPHADPVMQTVRYELVGDSLRRTNGSEVIEIVRGVGGLACKLYAPDTAVISASVQQEAQVYRLSTEVLLHRPAEVAP